MERRHAVSTQASEKACVAYDTSQLEDEGMYSSSEDEDENDEEAQERALARTYAVLTSSSPVVSALPEQAAPLGFLAAFSSHWNRSPSPLGADVFGIANKRYFQPSGSHTSASFCGNASDLNGRPIYRPKPSTNRH